MKILYISASIIPSSSANSINVMKMCSALTKLGHDVTLICSKGENINNNSIFDYYAVDCSFKIISSSNNRLGFLFRIISALKRIRRSDLIISRWPFAGFIVSKLYRKIMLFEYHLLPQNNRNRYFIKRIVMYPLVYHAFITETLKRDYCLIFPQIDDTKTIILPDGADVPIYHRKTVNKDKLNCGYIGSFQRGKGINTIIEIAKQIPHIKFHIIGGTKEEIKKIILHNSDLTNIIWHGYLCPKEAYKVLANEIDIALLPNEPDVYVGEKRNVNIGKWTSPIKMFEYMSYRKAIIASDIEVIKEILINNQNALLVKYDSVQEWKEAILYLCENKDKYNDLCDTAYNDFYNNYSWDIRAKKAMNMLQINSRKK